MSDLPVCPKCRSSQAVVKVSQVYVSGITEPGNRSDQDKARMQAVFGRQVATPAEIRQTVHLFGPPAGRTQITRPIHPDMYIFVLAVVAAFILINTFGNERVYFWVVLGISVLSGTVYYFTRASVVGAFRKRLEAAEAEKEAVNRAVGNWMRLYYCCDDGCVFDPARIDTAPLEELQRYLARLAVSKE
jgi:hypothetical protein